MAGINTAIQIADAATGPLMNITNALNMTLSCFEQLQQISGQAFDESTYTAAREEIDQATMSIHQLIDGTDQAGNEQREYNDTVREGVTATNSLLSSVKSLVGAYLGFRAVTSTINNAVEYSSDLTEVQNVVDVTFRNASSAIDEWSQNSLNAFGLNQLSAKQYAGTMGAMLKSSGLTGDAITDMSMKITELSGDMASFYNLSNDTAFEKIRSGISGETEPLKQLGINMSVANLQAFALSEGITKAYKDMSQAEQVTLRYNYLLAVTQDAQGDFARTSNSFANQQKLLTENWKGFTGELASNALPVLAMGMSMLNNSISIISDNWSIIQPILMGITVGVGSYTAALIANNAVHGIHAGLVSASAFAESVHAANMAMASGVTFSATVAQYGFNAALMACPITWIVLAVIALIAILYAAVGAMNKFSGSSVSATGIVMSAFAVCGAFLTNTFIVPTWNGFAMLANFVGNVFNNPVSAVKVLFYDMALTVIGYIQNMASAIEAIINKIPGVTVDITSGLGNFQSKLEAAQQSVKDESGWKEYVSQMDYTDYGAAARSGYSLGTEIDSKVSGFFHPESNTATSFDGGGFGGYSGDQVADNIANTAGNTAAMADSLDEGSEELAYLRDIAEQEAINRFTTAEIKVEMTNHNNISGGPGSADTLINDLVIGVNDAMEQAAEGVHI